MRLRKLNLGVVINEGKEGGEDRRKERKEGRWMVAGKVKEKGSKDGGQSEEDVVCFI